MNITSILLKKVILEADSETWARIRKHYLPPEFQDVYQVINKHFETIGGIPSFEVLKLSVRSNVILDKVYAVEAVEDVDVPTDLLLEFLKNEYTQEEIMEQLERFLDESIAIGSAKENIEKLQDIILHIEDRVELQDPSENMQTIELFASDEELERMVSLGLNAEHDNNIKFAPGEVILIGGRRGAGKSITCSNIAVNTIEQHKKSAIYFTIEMPSKPILQRCCSISTGISYSSLKMKNLTHKEWEQVASWWANRFDGGEEPLEDYIKNHHSFDKLHEVLSRRHKLKTEGQLDIVYDPSLTLSKIRSELDKKMKKLDIGMAVVDYANQVKRGFSLRSAGQYDWTEQIEVSKGLKVIAQEYGLPLVSPYQIDASGEARFAKGLLDAVDAAYTLNPWSKPDECMTFTSSKMRDNQEVSFTSRMDWQSLKIGPESVQSPEDKNKEETNEEVHDM